MRRRQVWAARQTPETPPVTAVTAPAVESKYLCPKCGKEFRRGMFIHQKHCKG